MLVFSFDPTLIFFEYFDLVILFLLNLKTLTIKIWLYKKFYICLNFIIFQIS